MTTIISYCDLTYLSVVLRFKTNLKAMRILLQSIPLSLYPANVNAAFDTHPETRPCNSFPNSTSSSLCLENSLSRERKVQHCPSTLHSNLEEMSSVWNSQGNSTYPSPLYKTSQRYWALTHYWLVTGTWTSRFY